MNTISMFSGNTVGFINQWALHSKSHSVSDFMRRHKFRTKQREKMVGANLPQCALIYQSKSNSA